MSSFSMQGMGAWYFSWILEGSIGDSVHRLHCKPLQAWCLCCFWTKQGWWHDSCSMYWRSSVPAQKLLVKFHLKTGSNVFILLNYFLVWSVKEWSLAIPVECRVFWRHRWAARHTQGSGLLSQQLKNLQANLFSFFYRFIIMKTEMCN